MTAPPLWGWTLAAIGLVILPPLILLAITWQRQSAGKTRAARRYQDL